MQGASASAPLSAQLRFPFNRLTAVLVRVASGIVGGSCLSVVLWSYWAQWGSGPAACWGLTVAAAAALAIGLRASQWRHTFQHGFAPLWCGLAVSVTSASLIASATLDSLRWTPAAAIEHPLVSTSFATIAALLCVGPTIGLLCVLTAGPRTNTDSGIADPLYWAGVALSLFILPLTVAITNGLQQLAWLLSGLALMIAVGAWRRGVQQAHDSAASPVPVRREQRRHPWHLIDLGHIVSGIVIGVSCALSLQMASQLQAGMAFVVFASLAGLFAGFALGMGVRTVRGIGSSLPSGFITGSGMLLSVISVAMLAAAFGRLIDVHLWLSATQSRLWVLLPMRALLAAAPLVPCGLAVAIVADERPLMMRGYFRSDLSIVVCACGAGFLLFRSWGPEPSTSLPWFEAFACGLSLLFLRVAMLHTHVRRRAVLAAGAGIVLTGAGIVFSDYDPARAARLLYSTNTFGAYRSGADADTLAVLDDGRLIATRSNGHATWTVWKHHGAQLQFRENGIPRHIVSTNLAVCPQSSSELLPAVAPLVMHPQPRHVLLDGLGSTAILQSCLAFPLASITCVESDPALRELASSLVSPNPGNGGLDDDRLRLLAIDAPLNAAADDRPYDVMILAATQSSLFSAVNSSTTDYYRRLARKLEPGGILCQRFQYVDFGAVPLKNMLATLRTVFPQVRILESAPGEVLLLATREDGPAIDAGLAVRAETPHVRRVMSQTGWDWSVLLGLAAVDHSEVDDIVAEASHPNVAADGRSVFALAPEVMRWGPKLDEIHQLLAPRSSQMLTWIGPCVEAEDAAKRLADVKEQRRVINENPERFWEYRKALKERLQNRPRSQIVPVSHEGLQRRLHPEDERRKEYLVALGEAARQLQPDAPSIQQVSSFVEPYDPLVSFFAHHEAAHLLSRSAKPDRRAELAHRLYTVYYGAGADRSVRNVTASLSLLVDSPESAESPQARWDDMNSLLEVLRHRWAARMRTPEQSRYAAADIDESLTAARRALRVMGRLASELSVDTEAWRHRRDLLEQELVHPLEAAQLKQTSRPQPGRRVEPPSAS